MKTKSTRSHKAKRFLSNHEIAHHLDEVAMLLETQQANEFRIQAYRSAAQLLRDLKESVQEILEIYGLEGLERLPGIGASLARSIEELAETRRLGLLERLRGEASPERMLATVPGIGPNLARRIHEKLGIESLFELESAAYDGRLAEVDGMGYKRILGVRESLAGRFRRRPPLAERPFSKSIDEEGDFPPVAELLDLDRAYREKARKGRLPRIAPRRFNPTGDAWLPIMHVELEGRHYTVLYSNTARAHELDTIFDWVVIYRDDRDHHGQWTVITSQYGPLRGKRIVRGLEQECTEYYAYLEAEKNAVPEPA